MSSSTGDFQPRDLRGLALRFKAMGPRSAWLCTLGSRPVGRVRSSKPSVFSLMPRSLKLYGCTENASIPVAYDSA